jgi:hypothetical protein
VPRSEQESYARNRTPAVELDRRAARIRALNDELRRDLVGGRVMITAGVQALPLPVVARALALIRSFDSFDADNDPHGEHDFGSIEVAEHRFFWKIDCYDRRLDFGSPDASDPAVTARVLTIMLAAEY